MIKSNQIKFFVNLSIVSLSIFISKELSAQNFTVATGFGQSNLYALSDAKRSAIVKACGEEISGNLRSDVTTLKSRVFNSDGTAEKSTNSNSSVVDETSVSVLGSIKSFKIIREGEADGGFYAEIEAIVGECPNFDTVQNARSNKAILSELRQISSQIALLSNRSGVIDQPKTYAEIYHNARIYAQRGEVDLALAAYEKLIGHPVQMADVISDLITLGKRTYGINGVKAYVDKKLKDKMPISSYLYAQVLMIDPGQEDDFDFNNFASREEWTDSSRKFPPLAYQILITTKPYQYEYHQKTWLYWTMQYSIFSIIKNSIENGDIFSYYIDQIRAGSNLEKYSQERIYEKFDEIFLFYLNDNLGFSNKDFKYHTSFWVKELLNTENSPVITQKRIIDVEKSPVVLDFTYFFENPRRGLVEDGGYYNNINYGSDPYKRENNLIEFSVWDQKVDYNKPFYVCAFSKNEKKECVDLNTEHYKCRDNGFQTEPYKCLYIHESAFNYPSFPNVKGTFSTAELLKSQCISQFSYTDGDGNIVEISADYIIATHAWPKGRSGNSKIENTIEQCGYQGQYTNFHVTP